MLQLICFNKSCGLFKNNICNKERRNHMSKDKINEEVKKNIKECTERNIHQRMLAVMSDIKYLQKTEKAAKGLPYKFISHDQVTGALHPSFVVHGIVCITDTLELTQDANRTVAKVLVSFVNADMPNDKVSVTFYGYGIDTQDKGPGKAISYATKMAYLKCFMLETGEDPERDNIDYDEGDDVISDKEYEILLGKIDEIKDRGLSFDEVKFKSFIKTDDYTKMNKSNYALAMLELDKKRLNSLKVGA